MVSVVRLVAALVVVAAVGCGCDGPGDGYGQVPTPSAPSASASVSPSPSLRLDPAKQQVVDRYLLYVRTLEKLYETTDPAKVDMASVATGAQFRNDVEVAIQMRNRHVHTTGHFDNRVSVSEFEAGRAILENCQGIGTVQTIANGSPSPTASQPPRLMQRIEMQGDKNEWKVSSIHLTGEC